VAAIRGAEEHPGRRRAEGRPIIGAEYLGTTQIVSVATPEGLLKARIPAEQRVHRWNLAKLITLSPPDTPLVAGDEVTIRYRNPLLFDADGNRLGGGAP